jgi:hypothetical protein
VKIEKTAKRPTAIGPGGAVGNEGAHGDTLLEVALEITEEELASYEWTEEGKPYHEWLVPAAVVNARATVRIVEDEGKMPSRFKLNGS